MLIYQRVHGWWLSPAPLKNMKFNWDDDIPYWGDYHTVIVAMVVAMILVILMILIDTWAWYEWSDKRDKYHYKYYFRMVILMNMSVSEVTQ